MRQWLRWLPAFLGAVGLALVAYFLVTYESAYLWKAQELNLFLDTPLFFKQQMVVSGGLLTWLGSFFTEFFYHPAVGVAMLCAWWVVLMIVAAKAFRVPLQWAVVLLIPVALLLISDVDLGYWIYYLKLRGHFFVATIGTTVALAAVWIFRCLPTRYLLPQAFILLSTIILYPLIGFYALLGALIMGVMAWRSDGMTLKGRVGATLTALLSVAVIPQAYYRFVFYQTNQVNIYWTGLPLFRYAEETPEFYIPYYILVAFMLLMALMTGRWSSRHFDKPVVQLSSQLLLFAGLAWGCYHFWYKDYNFHKELRMQQCLEDADWNGILAEAAENEDEPTRAIVMMRNLALFRLGRQGDMMYHYPAGAKTSNTKLPVHMTQVAGRSIYYNYGQLNFCYRWCLEDGVENGWRVEYLKYLVRCSLVNGEYRVARKYIDILKHTRYYSQWAEKHEKFLGNEKALREDRDFGPVFHMTGYDDILASDNSMVEYFLMNHFVNSHSDDPLYQEQTLLAALWSKDIQNFWPRFFEYAKLHPQAHMPVHYQEAAYLYGHLEHQVDIWGMPFDKQVVQDYNEFMAMAQRYNSLSEEQLRPIMYPRFGKTFYFEYFLVRNQKLY